MIEHVTPLVLTFDEAPNIERTLRKLTWATKIIVLDSFSTDETEAIARRFTNVHFTQRKFDNFAAQCNFGLSLAETDWVLSLDADYTLTDELLDEIAGLSAQSAVAAYVVRFKYCIFGRPLRGSLYPPRAVLFQKSCCHYVEDGHAHVLVSEGPTERLQGYLLHDDRKSIDRWLQDQRGYAQREARKLMEGPVQPRGRFSADRLRSWILPAAPTAFLYTLLVKRCLFDGWPGWLYTLQRTYAELLLSLDLLDRRLRGNDHPPGNGNGHSDHHG
jgi:glycosyltransferase involved in cell wall biosynthesis